MFCCEFHIVKAWANQQPSGRFVLTKRLESFLWSGPQNQALNDHISQTLLHTELKVADCMKGACAVCKSFVLFSDFFYPSSTTELL